MQGITLEGAFHGKFIFSNDHVFVTLHLESSENMLIREMQGSTLEGGFRGKCF
jgi:hypothetical protein